MNNTQSFHPLLPPGARLTLLAAFLILAGCTTPPDTKSGKIKNADELAATQSLSTEKVGRWPDAQWWLRYHDKQLNGLMDTALRDAPTLKIAESRLHNAAGIAEQIGAIRSVQLGAAASVSQDKVSYQYQAYSPPHGWNDYGSVTASLSFNLDFWGKNKAAVAAATSDYAASEAEMQSAKLLIETALVQAYAELTRLYLNRDTTRDALDVRSKTVELMQERNHNGLETDGVVRQMQARKDSAESALIAADEAIQLQKYAIAALLGEGPDQGLTLQRPDIHLDASFDLPANTGINLLGRRPDITAARWRVEAAAKRIHVARAAFYPDINITGFIGWQSFGLNNLTRSGNDAGSIGPALYLPIFTGGRLSGQLTSAEANYEESVAVYNNTLTLALQDVAGVVTRTKALKGQLAKTTSAYDNAKAAWHIADTRYRGGLATYLDVLTTEDAMLDTQRALVNLQSQVFSLDASLIHALGGGFDAAKS